MNEKLTVKELKEQLKALGAKGYSKLKKAELISLLEELSPKLHDSEVLFTGECSGEGEWLNHRRIGATDVSILMVDYAWRNGFIDRPDNYNSPLLMYLERKGQYKREFSFESMVAMNFGHYAEDFIINNLPDLFKREFNLDVQEVRKGNQVVANPQYPLWTCTPDSWIKINNEWYPVELKTGNSYQAYDWSKDEIPNKYYAQVQQQLAVLNKTKGFLVGFIDSRFTKVYEIDVDSKLIEKAYELSIEFQNCLDTNTEPKSNGCKAECSFFKEEFKGFSNKLETTPIVEINKFQDYTALKDTSKELSKELKELEEDMTPFVAEIQKKMLELQTEELIINNEYIATWKIDKRGSKRFNIKELPKYVA